MEHTLTTTRGTRIGKLVTNSKNSVEICLEDDAVFKMDGDQRGARIVSLSGNLWITQEGDSQDYHLGAGEQFRISRRGMVLVQGQRSAQARVYTRAG